MPVINLITHIEAPVHVCFDLARNIEAHQATASPSEEKVVHGKKSGLCEEGDIITWKAKHFGLKQKLTVKITKVEPFVYFEDEMVKGAFSFMKHKHYFEADKTGTKMTDEFSFSAPLGFIGSIAEKLFLTKYMTRFLTERNKALKAMAEKM